MSKKSREIEKNALKEKVVKELLIIRDYSISTKQDPDIEQITKDYDEFAKWLVGQNIAALRIAHFITGEISKDLKED